MNLMKPHLSYRCVLLFCLTIACAGVFVLGYLCSDQTCIFNIWTHQRPARWRQLSMADNMGRPLSFLSHPIAVKSRMSFEDVLRQPDFEFDIRGSDVIVFLHIQKTGGTAFGRHLVRNLALEQPCSCKKGQKKCKCVRPYSDDRLWLFSRYSTGWKCGLHADWTELTNCVDSAMDQTEKESSKRRYFYITLIREPVTRFLSEFRHVQRGATWKTARHMCGGRPPTTDELPPCFEGPDWRDVDLQQFSDCESNLARNRQTRMLADLTLVGCYNQSVMPPRQREIMMLASAKQNLQRMAFFGLCEQQCITQQLFEATFRLRFLQPFMQLNETRSSSTLASLSPEDLQKIKNINSLDISLYEFAKQMLHERHQQMLRHNRLKVEEDENGSYELDDMFELQT